MTDHDKWRSPGRAGETFLCPDHVRCPSCGQPTVVGILLVNEAGRHQHTLFVCCFWPSAAKVHCGWQGWFVPDEDED